MWWLVQVDHLVWSLLDQLQKNVNLLFQVLCSLYMYLLAVIVLVVLRQRGKWNLLSWWKKQRSLRTLSDSCAATGIWLKICFSDLKNLCPVYLDREMFLLSMLLISTSFKQPENLIVHYHLAKIVNGYMQQGHINGLLFGDNVFTSILMLPSNKSWLEMWRSESSCPMEQPYNRTIVRGTAATPGIVHVFI